MLKKLYSITLVSLISTGILSAAAKPNIVWITTEDNSATWLRVYDEENGVPMPNVERLANQGLVFNHAFSNGAVCSVARSALLSGCYPIRTGTQFHRHCISAPIPDGLKSYPEYFRDAGYYTANCPKTDYNYAVKKIWDDSSKSASYRNRKPNQPFFQVWSLQDTHESRMHKLLDNRDASTLITKPDEVKLYPYHPDTPLFRKSYAHYYDKHRDDDQRIGKLLNQLEEDGLMDDTIIFYYGDHGGVLPRSKGYIYESGLQVPLVIYIPENWKHLFPAKPGSRIDGFVSFVDFVPTVLNLADISVPQKMDGKAFLGNGVSLTELNQRDVTIGHADRFDEKYDMVRTLRKGRWKYMRSFQPFNVDGIYNNYRFQQAAYREWRELYDTGKLNKIQRTFFEKRAPEALYDLENDPHETIDAANDPANANVLKELREQLSRKLKNLPDLGVYPEAHLAKVAMENPVAFGREKKEEISQLIDIANLQLRSFSEIEHELETTLQSSNQWIRYWGLIVCSHFEKEALPLVQIAQNIYEQDSELLVRARAFEFLAIVNAIDISTAIKPLLSEQYTLLELLQILNIAALFKTTDPSLQLWFDEPKILQAAGEDVNQKKWIKRRIDFLKTP